MRSLAPSGGDNCVRVPSLERDVSTRYQSGRVSVAGGIKNRIVVGSAHDCPDCWLASTAFGDCPDSSIRERLADGALEAHPLSEMVPVTGSAQRSRSIPAFADEMLDKAGTDERIRGAFPPTE
ncbi:hypothetical protein [Natrinema limicola]|uniref:hypothetical protein n=1 Tax=Natrinema limicola TaxID=370323 RepID=UPI0012675C2F|nr:hypothetical protein [Natrinema limicola]